MKENIKYTIFGHSGFLGSNIVKYLKKKKYEVFLPSRNKIKFSKNLNNVIYCIGSDNVLENPEKGIESNLKLLSKILLKNKFKKFIFISSTRVYLNSKNTKENDNIKININSKDYFYNLLQASSENLCLSQKNKNIKVVRLSNLYGFNFKKQTYLLPNLIRNSKKNKKINISINKKSKKNYLNIYDAIGIIIKIVNRSKYRLYNIASDKRVTIEKIALVIKKLTNCKIIYSNQKIKYDEPIINISRIKKEYKFVPKNNLDFFLSEIIKKFST